MDANLLERYADLIVSVGANVQADQVVAVEALPEAQPLVAAVARRAYEKGARYVDVAYFDAAVKRIRDETAPEASLEWVPPWLGRRMLDLGDLDAARVVLVPLVPPGLLDGVDPGRAGRDQLPTVEEVFKVIDDRSVAWTLAPHPTRSWARVVYPELDAEAALARLWEDVIHVCRLDAPDPAAAWNERIEQIWQVARRLDALDLDALRFEGPGTDLSVGLLPSSRFAKEGGASHTRTGVRHVPNIPTEEVYTTPDPGAHARRRHRHEAARRLRLARDRTARPLRRGPGGRDRRGHERRGAPRPLRDRRGSCASRRGRARRPREPDRQARADVLHARCSTRTRPATWRSATRMQARSPTPPICRASTRARCTSTS